MIDWNCLGGINHLTKIKKQTLKIMKFSGIIVAVFLVIVGFVLISEGITNFVPLAILFGGAGIMILNVIMINDNNKPRNK